MIFPYPYFHFPYYHRPSRYGYYYPHPSTSSQKRPSVESIKFTEPTKPSINRPQYGNQTNLGTSTKTSKAVHTPTKHSCHTQKEEEPSCSEDSPLFQIFGLNLYFDDILLVCLIWFLYQEGVKDEGLFIALILLLLS